MNTKVDYVQQLEQQIAATKSTLEKLKAKRKQAMVAVQHEEIENLEKYLDQADVNMKGLSESAEEAWHEMKEAIEKLMRDIRNSLKKLMDDSDDMTKK